MHAGMALLGQSELEVCYFLAEADDYIPVKCSIHPDVITGNLLISVVSSFACCHCRSVCTVMPEAARTMALWQMLLADGRAVVADGSVPS